MKYRLTTLLLLSLPTSAELNWYLGASISQIEQDITFNADSENSVPSSLSALSKGFQLGASGENYSITASVNQAGDDAQWQQDNLSETASFDQNGFELSYSYYLDSWTINASYGQSSYQYDTKRALALPSQDRHFVDIQFVNTFENDDAFVELGVSRWFDLAEIDDNLAATLELSVTRYDSQGSQRAFSERVQLIQSDLADQIIADRDFQLGVQSEINDVYSETQLMLSISASLDYAAEVWQKDAYFSLWASYESNQGSEGQVTRTRAGRGRAPIPTTIELDETNSPTAQESLTTIGFDSSINLTNKTSMTLSVFDSDSYDPQLQLSFFHNF